MTYYQNSKSYPVVEGERYKDKKGAAIGSTLVKGLYCKTFLASCSMHMHLCIYTHVCMHTDYTRD